MDPKNGYHGCYFIDKKKTRGEFSQGHKTREGGMKIHPMSVKIQTLVLSS